MSNKKTGGPAFPRPFSKDGEYTDSAKHKAQDGMTPRDYFAAKAMQSYLAGPDRDDYTFDEWAKASYEMADAMLEARND